MRDILPDFVVDEIRKHYLTSVADAEAMGDVLLSRHPFCEGPRERCIRHSHVRVDHACSAALSDGCLLIPLRLPYLKAEIYQRHQHRDAAD
jgi:hypothetical protein